MLFIAKFEKKGLFNKSYKFDSYNDYDYPSDYIHYSHNFVKDVEFYRNTIKYMCSIKANDEGCDVIKLVLREEEIESYNSILESYKKKYDNYIELAKEKYNKEHNEERIMNEFVDDFGIITEKIDYPDYDVYIYEFNISFLKKRKFAKSDYIVKENVLIK